MDRKKILDIFETASTKTGYTYDIDDKVQNKYAVVCPSHGKTYQPFQSIKQFRRLPCCSGNKKITNEEIIQLFKEKGFDVYFKNNELLYDCPHHGTIPLERRKASRMYGSSPCRKCVAGDRNKKTHSYTLEKWLELARSIHGDTYDYSLVTLSDLESTGKVRIICKQHGEFTQQLANHIHLKNGCPSCTHHTSEPMYDMKDFFTSLGFIENDDFFVNDRKAISPKEIDFYFPKLKVGIEFNGRYFHSEEFKSKYYHRDKLELCEKNGIHLVHIFDYEWNEIAKSRIKSILGKSEKIYYGRKLKIKIVSKADSKLFLSTHHLQGDCVDSIRLGLYEGDSLVALMTFGKPRFNKKYNWELIRYCSSGNVIGGASKLLKYFREMYKGSIVSYANRNFSSSLKNVYTQLGFSLVGKTTPNYVWAHKSEDGKIYNRYATQKHKLKAIFPDDIGSEQEIMHKHNYVRVYDSGNLVFELL